MLLMLLLLCGCRSGISMHIPGEYQPTPPGSLDFGQFNQTPRPRMGSLPWPGLFSGFEVADPNNLGHHSYSNLGDETERGILYTCRGGFLDMAHVRKTIDTSKYVQVRVEMALLNNWSALRIKSLEPSVYILHLNYPEFWQSLSPDEKQVLARELSIRIGQRMAVLMMSWHELLTWFGYQSTPFLSEFPSAFTWDDTASHGFGAVLVADHALRDSRDWNDAVTDAINTGLHELGAVTPSQTMQAVEAIKGRWWSGGMGGGKPLKRHIEIGWYGQPIIPWLVPNLPFCPDATPHRYDLPRLDNVMGRNFQNLLRVEIEPNVLQSESIRRCIPGKPSTIDVDKDLPFVMDHMKNWHIQHEGEASLLP